MKKLSRLDSAYEAAMQMAAQFTDQGDHAAAFSLLERAHVLGQSALGRHLRVHVQMLRTGVAQGDRREVVGQLWRLFLTPFGHLFGRLPIGNTGRANISAFQSLPIDAELQVLLDEAAGPNQTHRSTPSNTSH